MSHKDFRRYECEAAGCSSFEDVEWEEHTNEFALYRDRWKGVKLPDGWGFVRFGEDRLVCAHCRAKIEATLWPKQAEPKLVSVGPYR